MSRNYRHRPLKKPERRVWVFSELNPHLTPQDVARILASAALEAAEAAKASECSNDEDDHA